MKIEKIDKKILKEVPLYYQFSQIGFLEKEDIINLKENLKGGKNFVSIEALNEPMFFPFAFFKPISKL